MADTGTFRDGRLSVDLFARSTGAIAELSLTQTELDVLEGTLADPEFNETIDIRLDRRR